jgi:chorismate synthase
VAAGAIARKVLASRGVNITAYTLRAGGVQCETIDPDTIEQNPMRAADPVAAEKMMQRVLQARDEQDSIGGVVECRIAGTAAGLGEPVFDKLDAQLAGAMVSLGAVKGVEFGAGFAAADMTGSEHNDAMGPGGFVTNHAGGVLGGISTGEEIVFRVAVKPTSSISRPQQTVDRDGNARTVETHGRHDPCICPRIVPVVEAMAALVLEDHYKRQAAMHS